MSKHHDRAGLRGRRYEKFRRAMLERAGYRCECCGLAGKLELHHKIPIAPPHNGDPWDPENCRVLRRECHLNEHRTPNPQAEAWQQFIKTAFESQ